MFYLMIRDIAALRDAVNQFERYIISECTETEAANGRLIVHELVSNVLLHSACPAGLFAKIDAETLEITVESSGGCGQRSIIKPSTETERGRGLFIVDALCDILMLEDNKTIAILRLGK